ncbi:MAG: hydrolase 1, exosortase A system-associated, partial [Novosphingobium sp.]
QAQFAARIAAQGFPVFRFDRRGIGDSEGTNRGFQQSEADIRAAIAAFRAVSPATIRIVGYGNCDAATALALAGGAGCDGLLLGNPWTLETAEDQTPPSVVRDHYRRRLADPAAILRLLTGKVSIAALLGSLRQATRPQPPANPLARAMADGLDQFAGDIRFLLAGRDRTAQAFLSTWQALGRSADPTIRMFEDASHSFVEASAREWLVAQTLDMLRG